MTPVPTILEANSVQKRKKAVTGFNSDQFYFLSLYQSTERLEERRIQCLCLLNKRERKTNGQLKSAVEHTREQIEHRVEALISDLPKVLLVELRIEQNLL